VAERLRRRGLGTKSLHNAHRHRRESLPSGIVVAEVTVNLSPCWQLVAAVLERMYTGPSRRSCASVSLAGQRRASWLSSLPFLRIIRRGSTFGFSAVAKNGRLESHEPSLSCHENRRARPSARNPCSHILPNGRLPLPHGDRFTVTPPTTIQLGTLHDGAMGIVVAISPQDPAP